MGIVRQRRFGPARGTEAYVRVSIYRCQLSIPLALGLPASS